MLVSLLCSIHAMQIAWCPNCTHAMPVACSLVRHIFLVEKKTFWKYYDERIVVQLALSSNMLLFCSEFQNVNFLRKFKCYSKYGIAALTRRRLSVSEHFYISRSSFEFSSMHNAIAKEQNSVFAVFFVRCANLLKSASATLLPLRCSFDLICFSLVSTQNT